MTRKTTAIILAVALYASGAVVTFGTVWNRIECKSEIMCADRKGSGALLAAMFWPLALSVTIQEPRP